MATAVAAIAKAVLREAIPPGSCLWNTDTGWLSRNAGSPETVDSEFLDGFNEGTVDDYAFSEATSTHYVHYSLKIPNEQIQLV